jgi:WD40 repeat protein/predicted Ser/Thr protein kinase
MIRKGAIDANAITLDNSSGLSASRTRLSPWDEVGGTRRIDAELFDPLEVQRLRTRVHASLFDAGDPERIGRFRVLERVGAGGMGVVYAVYDDQLDRKLAVKLLLGSASRDPEGHVRLLREAQTLARLSHPNVVQVHDVGEWQGRVFLAMEFVRGQTLRRWLADETPSVRAIVQVFARAGAGLAAAHRVGIVHRDFKPDNVIVAADGDVKVVDFGVARAVGDDAAAHERACTGTPDLAVRIERALTQTGQILGTPAYMAPEQITGDCSDARADQFSFAVTLFEALYGHRPFDGPDLVTLTRALTSGRVEIPRAPRVSRRIRDALLRALRPNPDDRFASMQGLLAALDPPVRRYAITLLAGVAGIGLGGAGLAHVYEAREAQVREQAVTATAQRDAEAERAYEAERALRAREDAVSLAEARTLLVRDPTRALATLLNISEKGWDGRVRSIAADALTRGVARRVDFELLNADEWRVAEVTASTRSEFGDVIVTCGGASGRLEVQRPESESPIVLEESCATEQLLALLVSPHGDAVALYADAAFEVYALESGTKRTVAVGPGLTGSMALAPRGEAVAVVGDDSRLRSYDVAGGGVHQLPGRVLGQVAFSSDQRTVAAIREDGGLRVWTRGGRAVLDVAGPMTSPRYAPDGRAIAAWRSGDDRARVWSLPSGEEVELGRSDGTSASAALKWSPEGRTVGAVVEGRVVAWDLATGVPWSPKVDEELFDIEFGPGGDEIVTLAKQGRQWERRAFSLPFRRTRVLVGHEGAVRALAQGTAQSLFSGGEDTTIRRWNLEDGSSTIVLVHPMSATSLAAGRNDRVVSSNGADLRTWHPASGEVRIAVTEPVSALAVDDVHDWVLWLDRTGRLHGYDPSRDAQIDAAELCRGCDRTMDHGQGFSRVDASHWRTIDPGGAAVVWSIGGRAQVVETDSDSENTRYGRLSLDETGFSARDSFMPFDTGKVIDTLEERIMSPRFTSDGTAVYAYGEVFRWDPQTDEHWPIFRCPSSVCRDALGLDGDATVAIADSRGFIWIVRDELPRQASAVRAWAAQTTSLRVDPLGDR